MELQLSDNIKCLRREHGLTQEQLAEALGVTVGAVYKWESRQSMPEIRLLVEIAEFFETSVDALLGYGWEKGNMTKTVHKIKELSSQKEFLEAASLAEKALKKYPNSFDVVYQSGIMYKLSMDPKKASRAIELLEQALTLLNQNSDTSISTWTIQNSIADCYAIMGQYEQAIALLKKNNYDGINSGKIGSLLAMHCKKPGEALTSLAEAMNDCLSALYQITIGYANAYCELGQLDEAVDITKWMLSVTKGLRNRDAATYLDKADVMLLLILADCCAAQGEEAMAGEYLKQARSLALRFDAAPNYTSEGIKFYHGRDAMAYDDFGVTAMAGIESFIADPDGNMQLRQLWQGVKV